VLKIRSLNYGQGKPGAMAMLQSPQLQLEVHCDVVHQKTVLAILLDDQLSFEPCLNQVLARGWSSFVTLFHAAESAGFSVPVLSAQVFVRIQPVVLFAETFLALAPRVLLRLNQLQWRWCKAILGCRYQRELKYHLVTA
jgi:hypothetical protein